MNKRNTTLHVLFIIMSAMQVYGMEDHQCRQQVSTEQRLPARIPTLQRLAGQKVIVQLEQKVDAQAQLSNAEFKTILAHKFMFTDLVNHDIYEHDGRIVLKKGKLLEKAVRTNHLQMTALLCALGVKVDEIILDKNKTLLHIAAGNGDKRIAKLLLDRGSQVNSVNEGGLTPLHYASYNGHGAIVELLLDRGAQVNGFNQCSWTPLHQASLQGHEVVLKVLLDRGAQVNSVNVDGWTPLYYATYYGHGAIVELLLDCGVPVNSIDKYGETPLHVASCNGHEAVVELLLDRGADVDIKGSSGKTCEYYTKIQSIRDLIAQARIDRKRKTDDNQFHQASCNGHEALVELLLDHDANIDCIDTQDRTREHVAESQATGDLIEQESIRRHHDSCCSIS